jgi:hypothetical protein
MACITDDTTTGMENNLGNDMRQSIMPHVKRAQSVQLGITLLGHGEAVHKQLIHRARWMEVHTLTGYLLYLWVQAGQYPLRHTIRKSFKSNLNGWTISVAVTLQDSAN